MKAPTTTTTTTQKRRHTMRAFSEEMRKLSQAFFQLASDIQPSQSSLIKNDSAERERIARDDPLEKRRLLVVNTRENRYGAAIFCVFGFLLWWAYAAFILLNSNYTYGFTQFRLPNSPGIFNNARYTYPWALNYMLYWNILGPITLLAAVAEIQYKSRLRIHNTLNVLLTFANIIAFFSFLGIWIGYCNNGWSFGSPCDSPLNCCVNYASGKGITWCPVTGAGCTPAVSSAQLGRWDYFFLSFLWSLFFTIYNFFAFSINRSLVKLKNPGFQQLSDRIGLQQAEQEYTQ